MKDFKYTYGNKTFVKQVKYEVGDLVRVHSDGPTPLFKSERQLTKGLYKITWVGPPAYSRGEELTYHLVRAYSSGQVTKYRYAFYQDFIEKISDLEKN